MKRFFAFVCTGLFLALMGCGGGGGGGGTEPLAPPEIPPPAPPPPPAETAFNCDSSAPVKGSDIEVSPGGIYFGMFVDCVTGTSAYVTAMVGEDGEFRTSSYDSQIYNLSGTLQTDGDSFQGSSRAFTGSGVFADLWLDGVIIGRKSLEGRWGNEWGGYGYFQLVYSSSYEWPDAWTSLLPYRELSEAQNGIQFRWTIGSDGQVSGWGRSGTGWNETNCTYTGQAVQRDPRFNLFDFEYSATGCTLAGSYSGLAAVLMFGDDTFQEPALQFQVNGGEKEMQMVVRLYGYY